MRVAARPYQFLSGLDRHPDAMLRSQRDEGPWDHRMAGHEAELPALGDRREHKDELHPGEGLANALARPATERKVRELGQRRFECGRPSIWMEPFRLWEEAGIAMHHPRAHEENRACRRNIAADRIWLDRAAADEPRGRIEAHRFGHDTLDKRKGRNVGNSR